ncbi:MAG TPA: hypothetical protein VG273_17750 [Bryobacteraceae bacterium]|jgi:hypothetical protein|nr:hypothetical protein [Bryobacteraceae bacterium]
MSDAARLTVLRRKVAILDDAIRVLVEYQNFVATSESRPALPAQLTETRVVELLTQRNLF